MHPYAIYTKFTTHEESRDTLIRLLGEAADGLTNISECKLYIINEDSHDLSVTWVTELWASKSSHDESLNTEGAKDLISKAMPLLKGRPEQIILNPVSGKGL